MRIQERCFLCALAGLCLLGGIRALEDGTTDATETSVDSVPGVEPLRADSKNDTVDQKTDYPLKESDSKTTTEPKKKPTVDFKPKAEQKYQKPARDDESKREHVESTTKYGETIPILLHAEPILPTTKFPSTTDPSSLATSSQTEESSSRGRALNISAPEPTNSLHANLTDLSDVSMDEDDKEVEGGEYVASHNETSTMNVSSTLLPTVSVCIEGNRTFAVGEKVVKGCEEKCVCGEGGVLTDCKPLCSSPYVRANRKIDDPLCHEKLIADEPCCAILVCAADSATEPEETCVFGNKTVTRGERVEDGCSRVCICEAGGNLKCQPRCPPNETTSAVNQHDRCVALTDPRDSCCTITLCDVTLGDHEIKTEGSTDMSVNLTDVKVLNSTSIKLKLSAKNPEDVNVEISDNNHVWRQQKPDKDGIISNLKAAHTYYVRLTEGGRAGPAFQVFFPAEVVKANITEKVSDKNSCSHRGKTYKVGAEWYDDCISFCICAEGGKTECVTIECPTDFGLDVLDPHCLDWETVPPNFVPKAPQCCPEEVRCRNNGSCVYEGKTYDNWSEIPPSVTGCEKHCYCELGNVSCQAACPPVPALPPASLPCPPYHAALMHLPDDECCLAWACNPSAPSPGMNVTPAFPGPLATDTYSQQSVDDTKRPNNGTGMLGPSKEPERGASSLRGDAKDANAYPDSTTHGLFHYPMDPGHPTVPYNGPYSPDYKPTHPTVEDVFRLSPHAEKPVPSPKEKAKSKSDAKKPHEPVKPHKDMSEQYFPGPLAPDRFPEKPTVIPLHVNVNEQRVPGPISPNKLPPPQKAGHGVGQPQFVPLNPQQNVGGFGFPSNSPQNVPQGGFVPQYGSQEVGPPFRGPVPLRPDPIDPNVILPPGPPKKKIPTSDPFIDMEKNKPPLPGRPKQGQRNPEQEILPEEIYHLINMQHPGLIQLDHGPPQSHPGLYELHQQIAGQKHTPSNQIQGGYFGSTGAGTKKLAKPQIYAEKNENGQTTYHVHASEVPSSPQQIEELLAHISQHDPNPGPFQHYPGQAAITHNIDAHLPHSGITHMNHPFAAQTPNQSGLGPNVPPGFPLPGTVPGNLPGFPIPPTSDEVTVQILEALDEHTVRLVFSVPKILVGLHGRVELRYTNDKTNTDVSTWKVQVFAPPSDLIATPQLEFELGDLKPSTEYRVKITVKMKDNIGNTPTSKIYSVRTLEKRAEVTTLPPQIPIDAELRVMDTNSTWINVMWKKFTEYELQFIDGVQLRYKEHDGKVYTATPLIHRAVRNYVIENLKPTTTYEVGIVFVPFPGQLTELISEKTVQVTTSMEPDPYSFDVKVEIKSIKSTDVEVTWSGVPYPEDKYVNIFRAIYQSDSGKEDASTFKMAKRDSHAKTIISDLKPGTRYRLWLEVYLTNGRIKKSNVQDFVTKPGVLLSSTVSQSVGKPGSLHLHEGDYYGPLVVVAIVASLAILSTLILLMMLMKRRTSSKADISPRKTTSAYDNPSYKTCEDAVGVANARNKNTEHEMATINSNAKETA